MDGLYSTFIGDNPASSALLTALTNAALYVEVAVNGSALSSREQLASVGYSLTTRGLLVTTNNSIVLNPAKNAVDLSAHHATIGGGGNVIGTNAKYAVLRGGQYNAVGNGATNAFADGYRAKANHYGACVWGDSWPADIASTNESSVTFRAGGGSRLFPTPSTPTAWRWRRSRR